MCGILGVRRSWLDDRHAVRRALRALAWRGPDDLRLQAHGDWWLGVARLAITDPASPQPIRCPRSGRVVVMNGAATSAAAERRRFGARLRTGNDAELALARFEAGGPEELTATCGPYALAVVDPRSDTLWLARDPEGEKPLHVVLARGRGVVAFASSLAALAALGIEIELAPADRSRALRYGLVLGVRACRADLEVCSNLRGLFEARGGELRPLAGRPPEVVHSAAGFAERVRHAVARCADAEVPVGLCLSGGVDSSCLAAALALEGFSMPAYQARARGACGVERRLARLVAARTGHALVEVDLGPEVLDALEPLTRATGWPQSDPSVLAMHALARRAHADGVRVLLSGEGADDLWLGYRRHRAAARLPRHGLPLPAPPLGTGIWARLARALGARRPYDALLEVSPPGFLEAVLAEGFGHEDALPDPVERGSSLERARFLDREVYLRHDLLPKADTATMAAGIEARLPYLDPELLAAPETVTLPARRVLGKRALRRAFARVLPSAVLRARKRGFGLPLDRWLREDDRLCDLLRERRTLEREHLRPRGLSRMLDLHRRGAASLGHPLYAVAALELWLRWREDSRPRAASLAG